MISWKKTVGSIRGGAQSLKNEAQEGSCEGANVLHRNLQKRVEVSKGFLIAVGSEERLGKSSLAVST